MPDKRRRFGCSSGNKKYTTKRKSRFQNLKYDAFYSLLFITVCLKQLPRVLLLTQKKEKSINENGNLTSKSEMCTQYGLWWDGPSTGSRISPMSATLSSQPCGKIIFQRSGISYLQVTRLELFQNRLREVVCQKVTEVVTSTQAAQSFHHGSQHGSQQWAFPFSS